MFSSRLYDLIVALCEFEKGATGILDLGWSHHGVDKNYLSITLTGSNGTAMVDFEHLELYLEEPRGGLASGSTTIYNAEIPHPVGYELGGKNLSPDLERFAEAILQGKVSSPNWHEGYLVDELVEAINLSLREKIRVDLPLEV